MLPAGARRPAAPLDAAAPVLGRLGSLEVRLARSKAEIRAAQHLRYHVFYEEMSARPSALQKMTRRDADAFDRICDHLLVLDRDKKGSDADQIVGTYRLLRQPQAEAAGGFYTAGEFEIDTLVRRHPGLRFLELGRSCVLPEYRGKRTVELLWQGIWAYVLHHRIDVLFGCASLAGTDTERLGGVLTFLKASAPAPDEWRVRAVASRRGPARADAPAIDPKRALGALPPLLKGYLRLGGYVGEDPVVDHQFGTTDVLIVLPVSRINPRYVNHYGADAGRFAA
ncbi:GNAT family N-acyltransferase [Aureimonas sp. ME7]|uniref:GNAT family N-acetyltransferase n=1 Tax=Aureimonas sp. ME7 TaxID=2744252 RepID=UPI001FCE5A92|nr:GNAT family N-acyltransferase [Aureimonas sp. ME7]